MVLEEIDRWAGNKGILVMGTGDFTHPAWFKEIKEKLEPAEPGLFKLKKQFKQPTIHGDLSETRFLLEVEISGIYSKQSKSGVKKVYRIHNMIFAPDIETVEKINTQFGWIGNLASDGRPILGLDSEELAKIVFNTNPKAVIVPAHCWTPWFSLFGSMSGFDSIEECFGDYSKQIFAVETGLSSDPSMNWRLSALDKITLISNSDSHSPAKIGREANVFDTEISYPAIISAIKQKNPQKFLYTIEFFPEEGKYHFDGHRLCNIVLSPQESKKYNNICPNCGKPLTIGVLNRVNSLADRPEGFKPEIAIPFKSLIPLAEIIADALGVLSGAKQVEKEYKNLIEKFGNEFEVLLNASFEDLKRAALPEIAEGIIRVREGKVFIEPGYDGVYGKIKIFSQEDKKDISKQGTLL